MLADRPSPSPSDAQATVLDSLRTLVASDLPLRDSHHHPLGDLSISQHRRSRERLAYMTYPSPFLRHTLSPRFITPPCRPNLRKPDLLPRHRVSRRPTRTHHVASLLNNK
ncbi:hypothetical protein M422DRAFT_245866 [Sphaerobolus stellatus SS14]|nr:hypothetical protein M422DRAFT_245866 [Sphaerobolus stellatus SS14]